MNVYSKKVPFVGLGLILAGIVWFCVFIWFDINPYLIVFPAAGLFLTGFGVIGAWVALTLWFKNSK